MSTSSLGKMLAAGLPAGLLFVLFHPDKPPLALMSDCAFWAGIVLLLTGLFRLTLWLGLYDGVIYSFKKLREVAQTKKYVPRESELGSRPEYAARNGRHGAFRREHLLAGGIWLLVSLLLALFA